MPSACSAVLADGKHFRAGAARLRRVALFFIDDATRYGLQVLVGTAESSELFLRALYEMVMRHGLADLFFLDKGPGFISKDTQAVVQGGLGALLIHGTTRYPQGHGAIERFHRTAYDQVLRSLDGAADVDPACAALTLRLRHFLERYNDTPHETLGKDTTPRQCWERGRDLRFPPTTPICTAASWCAPCTRFPTITSSRPTVGCGKRRAAAQPVGSRWRATCSTVGCGFSTRGA